MTAIVGFIVAALVLVFFEIILPGGVLGVLAALCVVVATWLGFDEFGALGGIGIFVGSCLVIAATAFIEFKLLAKTSLGKGFFLKASITGHSNESKADDSILGKEGTALTRLNPSGKVAIEGQSYEAYSQDGYIESGEFITVVKKDNFKLIIRKL
ncbi:MAG: NfeD family protein [Opitutaceae bacterium]